MGGVVDLSCLCRNGGTCSEHVRSLLRGDRAETSRQGHACARQEVANGPVRDASYVESLLE